MVAEFTDNEDLIDLIAFGLSGFDALEISHDVNQWGQTRLIFT